MGVLNLVPIWVIPFSAFKWGDIKYAVILSYNTHYFSNIKKIDFFGE